MKIDLLATLITVGFTLISILAFLAAKYGGVDSSWSRSMMDTILPMIVQAWILNFTVIIQHRYGSSQGSANKDDLIKDIINRPPLNISNPTNQDTETIKELK